VGAGCGTDVLDLLNAIDAYHSEVEAVVRSPTNMAAAKIAAVDFNKMTSLDRPGGFWGRSASQSMALIPPECTKTHHFDIKNQKKILGRGPLPRPHTRWGGGHSLTTHNPLGVSSAP